MPEEKETIPVTYRWKCEECDLRVESPYEHGPTHFCDRTSPPRVMVPDDEIPG